MEYMRRSIRTHWAKREAYGRATVTDGSSAPNQTIRLRAFLGLLLLVTFFGAAGAFCQDQIEVVSPPSKLLPSQVEYPTGTKKPTLEVIRRMGDRKEYQAAAKALIAATLASPEAGEALFADLTPTKVSTTDLDDPKFSCIIHVLKWKDTEMAIDQEQWFTYQGGKWS